MASVKEEAAAVAPAVESRPGGKGRGAVFYGVAAFLSLIGLADTIYLTVKHITGGIVPCTVTGGCEQVLNSAYSTIAGVPLAAIGAAAYFTVFSLATLAAFGNRRAGSLLFYLSMLMLLFSVWLFFVQAFILHAFCQFCLLSGALSVLLATTMIARRIYSRRNPEN